MEQLAAEKFGFSPELRDEVNDALAHIGLEHTLARRESPATTAVAEFILGIQPVSFVSSDRHGDTRVVGYPMTLEEEKKLLRLLRKMADELRFARQPRGWQRFYPGTPRKKYDVIDFLGRRLAADIPRETSPPS